jgi:ketosteroid isomerase-like protein
LSLIPIVTKCGRLASTFPTLERDMSGEDNKSLVKSFVKAMVTEDLEQLGRLTTDDFTFWVAPTTIASGTYTKDNFLQLMSEVFGNLARPMTLQLGDITAEDDRVSLTMVGNILYKNGKVYNGNYHNLFFLRDGKISAVKEYPDTYHVGEIFGFPNATHANESGIRFAAN